MIELIVLLIGILIMILLIQQGTISVEAFDAPFLTSCPTGYKIIRQSDGTTLCCDGEIAGSMCLGKNQCVLNGSSSSTIPQCAAIVQESHQTKAENQCPSSRSTYFEDSAKKIKGCTDGPLTPQMNAPLHKEQPTCSIYDNLDDNYTSMDSCLNQKDMEDYPCFGLNCTKQLIQPAKKKPVLLSVSFADVNGVPHVAYTRASMERYLDATKPNWRDKGMDTSKNIAVAEVAKAYYMDRTMSKEDIMM